MTRTATRPRCAGCDRYPGVVQSAAHLPDDHEPGRHAGQRHLPGLSLVRQEPGVTPLFPFGYGLSYTTFEFSNLTVTPRFDGSVDVAFDMQNTGTRRRRGRRPGLRRAPARRSGVQQAVRSLRGFDRDHARAGRDRARGRSTSRRARSSTGAPPRPVGDRLRRSARSGSATATRRRPCRWRRPPRRWPRPATTGTVGGTVPATLALTLGAPATLRRRSRPASTSTYTASTTADRDLHGGRRDAQRVRPGHGAPGPSGQRLVLPAAGAAGQGDQGQHARTRRTTPVGQPAEPAELERAGVQRPGDALVPSRRSAPPTRCAPAATARR